MKVYKFGGTSIADGDRMAAAAEMVAREVGGGPAIVVVSATAGTTDVLLEAVREACCGGDWKADLARFVRCHDPIASRFGAGDELRRVGRVLARDLGYLARGVRSQGRVVARVVAQGEMASSALFAAALRKAGVDAVRLTPQQLGMLTFGGYSGAEFKREALPRVARHLRRLRRVAVVPGFVGATGRGEITTLSRGGSDYSAAFLAAAAAAEELCIYTDVDGIMSADPRVVPGARPVRWLSYAEAAELSYFGARVLHPGTIEPAVSASVPVRVRNAFRPDDPGTLVCSKGSGRGVAAIACQTGIDTLNVVSTRMLNAHGFLARIFDVMRRRSVCVDVIATSEVSVSMTVDPAETLDAAVEELATVAEVTRKRDRAVVCAVGERMRGSPRIVSRIFAAVARVGAAVEMVSQGASRINLTFVVRRRVVRKVLRSLHAEFFDGRSADAD